MKKYILTIALGLISQAAMATDLYCGANIETVPGSQAYNKLVFWDKVDTAKPVLRFLLADGTVIKSEDFTPANLEKVVDGTLAMSISFTDTRPVLMLAKVKRNVKNEIAFTNTALASPLAGRELMLIANDASMTCKEL